MKTSYERKTSHTHTWRKEGKEDKAETLIKQTMKGGKEGKNRGI